jgi:hypothetical protein
MNQQYARSVGFALSRTAREGLPPSVFVPNQNLRVILAAADGGHPPDKHELTLGQTELPNPSQF